MNRENRDNQDFKDYVIQHIKDFVTHNPETWIKLNLSGNRLGNDLEFVRRFVPCYRDNSTKFEVRFSFS